VESRCDHVFFLLYLIFSFFSFFRSMIATLLCEVPSHTRVVAHLFATFSNSRDKSSIFTKSYKKWMSLQDWEEKKEKGKRKKEKGKRSHTRERANAILWEVTILPFREHFSWEDIVNQALQGVSDPLLGLGSCERVDWDQDLKVWVQFLDHDSLRILRHLE